MKLFFDVIFVFLSTTCRGNKLIDILNKGKNKKMYVYFEKAEAFQIFSTISIIKLKITFTSYTA